MMCASAAGLSRVYESTVVHSCASSLPVREVVSGYRKGGLCGFPVKEIDLYRPSPIVLAPTPCSPCSSTFTRSSRRSFSFRKMHTDMGDERGIRLRCICLGDAALRGSRMSARGLCGKGSESRIARSSLSNARSSVRATTRCLRINITIQHNIRLRVY